MRQVTSALLYLSAIVSANLILAAAGPENAWWAMPVIAFTLIGLDLALRDSLHEAWRGHGLLWKMGVLIVTGGVLSWLINPESGRIAIASALAFTGGAAGDAFVWHFGSDWSYLRRANASNCTGALVDSILFPTIAFSSFLPAAVLGQFIAKATGGALWSYLLKWFRTRYSSSTQQVHSG